ncbi:MAG: 3-oxoacyl-ACP reductase FabG [Armatimonadetes bacterium]|nr:3-oxoacyl-ACP reductase FabG [Armatimonadota bacterium]
MGIEIFSLEGKVALVTGGSKGLGEAGARALAEAGASVILTSRHGEQVEAVAAAIQRDTGQRTLAVEADVGRAEDVERTVATGLDAFGQIDILVNNAGVNRHGLVHQLSEEDWSEVLRINLTGPVLCARAVTQHMIPRRSGRIINIASTFGLVGYPKRSAYCASKGGLINLTRCWAVELAPHNITVNAICPGPFDTPLTRRLITGAAREDFTQQIPLGRWGDPRELVGAVLYLASEAASFTTGAVLTVDGGWTAR